MCVGACQSRCHRHRQPGETRARLTLALGPAALHADQQAWRERQAYAGNIRHRLAIECPTGRQAGRIGSGLLLTQSQGGLDLGLGLKQKQFRPARAGNLRRNIA